MRYLVVTFSGMDYEVPSGEARMWAMLSYEAFNCNVYALGGAPVPLTMYEIV